VKTAEKIPFWNVLYNAHPGVLWDIDEEDECYRVTGRLGGNEATVRAEKELFSEPDSAIKNLKRLGDKVQYALTKDERHANFDRLRKMLEAMQQEDAEAEP
jgi:hypothetical protein